MQKTTTAISLDVHKKPKSTLISIIHAEVGILMYVLDILLVLQKAPNTQDHIIGQKYPVK